MGFERPRNTTACTSRRWLVAGASFTCCGLGMISAHGIVLGGGPMRLLPCLMPLIGIGLAGFGPLARIVDRVGMQVGANDDIVGNRQPAEWLDDLKGTADAGGTNAIRTPAVDALARLSMEKLEGKIESHESRVREIDALLIDPDVYTDGARCRELTTERATLLEELEPLEFEWARRADDVT